MSIWMEGVVAFLAAVGLTTLLWMLSGAVLRRRETPLPAVMVLPASGGAEELEWTVRRACAALPGDSVPILLVDCGLTEEARMRTALLEKTNSRVTEIKPEDLRGYFARK